MFFKTFFRKSATGGKASSALVFGPFLSLWNSRLRGELDENDGGDDVVRIGGGKRALNAEEGGGGGGMLLKVFVLVGVPSASGEASPMELAWSPSNRYDESTSMEESIIMTRKI